jgi:hypothetical protein
MRRIDAKIYLLRTNVKGIKNNVPINYTQFMNLRLFRSKQQGILLVGQGEHGADLLTPTLGPHGEWV